MEIISEAIIGFVEKKSYLCVILIRVYLHGIDSTLRGRRIKPTIIGIIRPNITVNRNIQKPTCSHKE